MFLVLVSRANGSTFMGLVLNPEPQTLRFRVSGLRMLGRGDCHGLLHGFEIGDWLVGLGFGALSFRFRA